MGGSVIKEFLVSLGIKIDKEGFKGIASALNGTSSQLNNVGNSVNNLQGDLKNFNNTGKKTAEGIQNIGKVVQNVVKGIANGIKMITNAIKGIFGFIGGIVKATLTPFKKAIEGIKNGFKSIVNLAKEDLAFQTLARKMMLPLKVARRMTIALETLGASIEDIHLNPELFENYKRLMEDSKTFEGNLDFKEQMKSMRNFLFEFARLRQYFRYGAYAIADGFLRAFGLPLKKVTEWLQNLNKNLIGNFNKISATVEKYTKPIADFFVILFKEGKKAFEGLGQETKGFINGFIEMFTTAKNPIAVLLGMLEDFNIWHEIGDSVLAPFWEGLTNKIKEVYNDFRDKIEGAIQFVKELWNKIQKFFTDSDGGFVKLLGSLDKIAQSLEKIAGLASNVGGIFKDFGNMFGSADKEAREVEERENIEILQDKLYIQRNKNKIKNNNDFQIFKEYLQHKNNFQKNPWNLWEQWMFNATKQLLLNSGYQETDLANFENDYNTLEFEASKEHQKNKKQNIHNQARDNFEQKLKQYEPTIKQEIAKANKKYGTDITYDDIKAILKVENGQLDPEANPTNYDGSTDTGLMQINSIHGKSVKWLQNPKNNLQFGIDLFAKELQAVNGIKEKAFKAYHAGAGGINSTIAKEYFQKIQNTGYYNRNPFMPVGLEFVATSASKTPQYFTPYLQAQSNPISCGQTSTAMAINSLTGKKLTDNDINRKYGLNLLGALNAETKNYGFSWKDSGNLFQDGKAQWDLIEQKTKKGLPVMIGLGGEFTSSNGHIMLITSVNGDKVTLADPNGGRERVVSKSRIEKAKPNDYGGQFLYTATSSDSNYNKPFITNPKTKGSTAIGYSNTIQQGMKNSAVIKNSLTGQTGNYGAGTMLNNIVNINGGINVNVKNANATAQEIGNAIKVAFEEKTKFIQTGRRVAQVRAC